MASTSPAFSEKLTSRTACASPAGVKKLTERCSTFNKSAMQNVPIMQDKGVSQPLVKDINGVYSPIVQS